MALTVSPRLEAFLTALPSAGDDEWVSPPGLDGTWRARLIRTGLERGVLVVHWSGAGLCFARQPRHGACQNCVTTRSICDHCSCPMCAWERQCEERNGRPVSRQQVLQLLAKIQSFRFGQPAPSKGFDL